jgi:hypothetical protein
MQTINDVLFGVISLGLSKYLDKRSPGCKFFLTFLIKLNKLSNFKFILRVYQVNYLYLYILALKEGLQITGVALVNLRPSPGLQVPYLNPSNTCLPKISFFGFNIIRLKPKLICIFYIGYERVDEERYRVRVGK